MATITGDSIEAVAYALMQRIADAEGREWSEAPSEGRKCADRQWTLATFHQCLQVAKGIKPAG